MIEWNSGILDLCELMHKETEFSVLEFNRKKLDYYIKEMRETENCLVLTEFDKGKAVGVFIGECYPHIYTDELIAVDQLMYVHPDFRRKGFARKMVDEYKAWAKSKEIKMIMIGSSTGFEGAEDFFKSCNFYRVGGNYTLRGV